MGKVNARRGYLETVFRGLIIKILFMSINPSKESRVKEKPRHWARLSACFGKRDFYLATIAEAAALTPATTEQMPERIAP